MSHEDRLIRKMLGVKNGDSLPFKGWRHTSTRQDLYKIFAALGYKLGAEVGVAEGRNARDMLAAVPDLHLTLVDPWAAYGRYSQALCDTRYEWAQKRIGVDVARFGDDRTVIWPRQGLCAFQPIEMRQREKCPRA